MLIAGQMAWFLLQEINFFIETEESILLNIIEVNQDKNKIKSKGNEIDFFGNTQKNIIHIAHYVSTQTERIL